VDLWIREHRDVVDGHDYRLARAQRHRVVRLVDHVHFELAGQHRQAGLFPGEPSRAMRNRGRARDYPSLRSEPGAPLRVGTLAGNR
jgi:hypothetical protein